MCDVVPKMEQPISSKHGGWLRESRNKHIIVWRLGVYQRSQIYLNGVAAWP